MSIASTPPPRSRRRTAVGAGITVVVAAIVAATLYGLATGGFAAIPTASAIGGSSAVPTLASNAASPSPAGSPEPTLGPWPLPTPVQTCAPAAVEPAKGAVPILYLHRVIAPPTAWLTWSADQRRKFLAYDVLPSAFEADLDWLQAHGYTTILPRDLAAHWDHGAPLPEHPVIITFDDGSHSWVETVLPMLRARKMVAEFYLTLDAIRSGGITWREVRTLAEAGMGIGAHDVHHVQLANLGPRTPPASPDTMWTEVNDARVIIGEHIGVLPDSMAYVGGGFDPTLESLVRKAGYTTARSIIRGIHQREVDRFQMRVVALAPRDDVVDPYLGTLVCGLPTFAAKMTGLTH